MLQATSSNHLPQQPVVEAAGRLIAERLVRTLIVEEVKVAINAHSGLAHGVVRVQVHLLVLERAPEPLDEDVVDAASLAVHADLNTTTQQDLCKRICSELRALIRVEDLGLSEAREGLIQRLHTEGRLHRV